MGVGGLEDRGGACEDGFFEIAAGVGFFQFEEFAVFGFEPVADGGDDGFCALGGDFAA